jgi:hypothetical protein
MARLKTPFCVVAFEIRVALDEGRRKDAEALAIAAGNSGYHSPEFSKVMVELLQPRGRGRPKHTYPPHWLHVQQEWDELRLQGVSANKAAPIIRARLIKRLGPERAKKLGVKTIRNVIIRIKQRTKLRRR